MMVYLAEYLETYHSGFNVFQYITLRAVLAVITALLISFVIAMTARKRICPRPARRPWVGRSYW